MSEEEIKAGLDKVYKTGFRNGGIEKKNKILRSLNRDWKLFRTKTELDLLVKVLKKINKL